MTVVESVRATVRLAVLAALDEAAREIYGTRQIGWQDRDLPELFSAIDAQADRIFERQKA